MKKIFFVQKSEGFMHEVIDLLKVLISTPSVSREESGAAAVIRSFLKKKGIGYFEKNNNTWALNRHFDPLKPNLLLNSHIDTVKPAQGWTYNPFIASEEGDRITGLGSNDAGGPLVALLAVFLHYYENPDLTFNLIYAATAEEENSGADGFESIKPLLPPVKFAIVGEPTGMNLAIAERGLLVLDCTAHGKSGHAAREEGVNALYIALDDIQKLRDYSFEHVSDMLGPVKITATQIEAGTQHNVVPDVCKFVLDVRTNEFYTNENLCRIIASQVKSEIRPRSFRLNSSGITATHPFVEKARSLGVSCYGSPTTSDQAIMPWPSVKMGPGDSSRSHTANEYIYKSEIIGAVEIYIKLLDDLHL